MYFYSISKIYDNQSTKDEKVELEINYGEALTHHVK